MVETAKERGGHDNITGVVVSVVELLDNVPGLIERDETAPVNVGDADTFDAEERTENISPRDLDKLGIEPLRPARGDGHGRATAPMLVVTPPGSDARGSDTTDPGIAAPPDDGRDLEALEPSTRRQSMADEPTLPTAPAIDSGPRQPELERSAAGPPPEGGQGGKGADAAAAGGVPAGAAPDDVSDAIPPDSLALGDTGPLPKADR